MFRVLQHYLPIRTALLVFSETILLTLALVGGMSRHLWDMLEGVGGASEEARDRSNDLANNLANLGLMPGDAMVRCVLSAFILALLCQVAIGFNQLYDFQVSSSRYERAARFVESTGTALALSLGIAFIAHVWGLTQVLDFPGLSLSQRVQALVASVVTGFGLLYIWRGPYHWLMRRVNLNQRMLILGSRGPAHSLAKAILRHPDAGYELAGLVPEPGPERVDAGRLGGVTDAPIGPPTLSSENEPTDETRAFELEAQVLGAPRIDATHVASGGAHQEVEGLFDLVRELMVDVVVVAIQDRRLNLPTDELLRCRLAGVEVREREDVYEQVTGRLAVEAMRPSYLIFNKGFGRHHWAALLKRAVDVTCSLLILALTWPLMILTAITVRLSSNGPILFTQERVGQDGKPFTLMKFRSMRADAEKHTGPVWSSEDDPRITKAGRFLRKTRLDELPQLFNILGGSMSLVGPRPERQHFVDELATQIPYFHQRHIVKPGLTGWAQIKYPYGNTTEDALNKLQYDLFYIKNQSLLFDLSILFNTIKTVVLRQGT